MTAKKPSSCLSCWCGVSHGLWVGTSSGFQSRAARRRTQHEHSKQHARLLVSSIPSHTSARTQGVYVLQDNAFKPLRSISTPGGPQETARAAKLVSVLFSPSCQAGHHGRGCPLSQRCSILGTAYIYSLISAHILTPLSSTQYLSYPIGIIRGALSRLGVPSAVVGETSQLPACTFHVKTSTTPAPAVQATGGRA